MVLLLRNFRSILNVCTKKFNAFRKILFSNLLMTLEALMWSDLKEIDAVTNTITALDDGMVSVMVPIGVELCAYVNDIEVPLHHVHVKAGDSIHFKLKNHASSPSTVSITMDGETHELYVLPSATTEGNITTKLSKHKKSKEYKMTPAETINLFSNPGMGGAGAGAGAGLGAGLLGGVLGGALLGRRGVLGGGEEAVGVTPTQLQTGLDSVTANNQNTTILQTLGDIKAAVPLAEAQVQLALAGAQNDINANITASLQTAINGQAIINSNIANSTATSLASQSSIKEAVLSSANANLTATMNSKFELANVVRDDGDRTRALIVAQNDAMLNRQLATAEAALLEQRAIGRTRDVEVNVTQTVMQNQQQLQAQAQQQQQFQITNSLLQSLLSQAQIAQATNQQLIIGNTGYASGGNQTANPVNVRA